MLVYLRTHALELPAESAFNGYLGGQPEEAANAPGDNIFDGPGNGT